MNPYCEKALSYYQNTLLECGSCVSSEFLDTVYAETILNRGMFYGRIRVEMPIELLKEAMKSVCFAHIEVKWFDGALAWESEREGWFKMDGRHFRFIRCIKGPELEPIQETTQ